MNNLNEIAEILAQDLNVSQEQILADLQDFVNSYTNKVDAQYEALEYIEASDLLVQAASNLLEGNTVQAFKLFIQAVNDPSSDVVFNALANWNEEAINTIVANALEQADPVEFDDALEHNWQSDGDDEQSGNGDGNDFDPETHYPSWVNADDEEPLPGDIGMADENNPDNDPDDSYTKDDAMDDDSSSDSGIDPGPIETDEQTASLYTTNSIANLIARNKASLHGYK